MSKFDFNDVDVNKGADSFGNKPKYMKLSGDKPHARTVKITSVIKDVTTHGEPFIKVSVTDTEGYIAENDFFINTEVKPGKQTSSFNVSKTDFVKFLVVTGKNEEEAKTFLGSAKSEEDLAAKISTAVGKSFNMGFWGKIVTQKNGNKFLKTMFAQGKNNILPVTSALTDVNTNNTKDESTRYTPETDATIKKEVVHTDDLPF
jgi:hypothetical protein